MDNELSSKIFENKRDNNTLKINYVLQTILLHGSQRNNIDFIFSSTTKSVFTSIFPQKMNRESKKDESTKNMTEKCVADRKEVKNTKQMHKTSITKRPEIPPLTPLTRRRIC